MVRVKSHIDFTVDTTGDKNLFDFWFLRESHIQTTDGDLLRIYCDMKFPSKRSPYRLNFKTFKFFLSPHLPPDVMEKRFFPLPL